MGHDDTAGAQTHPIQMNPDQIYIRELEVQAIIGIRAHERIRKQTLTVSLWMARDLSPSANSENIEDTLDYGAVCRRLEEMIESSEFLLLEALAEAITTVLQKEFSVKWFRLQLGKPGAVPDAREVGLIIERALQQSPD